MSIEHNINGNYMCSNCQYTIAEEKDYKIHYKSDFHRYNIKRRLLELQPASYEQFITRKNKTNDNAKAAPEDFNFKCDYCNKSFASKNTYSQHLQSKKHQIEEEISKERVKSEKKEFVPQETTLNSLNICLFCNNKETTLELNLEHMRISHSFFIIEETFLTNLQGLLKFIAEKINLGLLCLYCDNKGTKGFKTAEAVRNHMTDKSHCFMNSELFEEFEDFYDFTSQFEELEREDLLANKKTNNNVRNIEVADDNEWEDEGNGKKDQKNHKTYKIRKVKLLENGEVLLPDGKIIGHRCYNHIYKQKYVPLPYKSEKYKSLLGSAYESRVSLINQNTQIMLAEQTIQLRDEKVNFKMNKVSTTLRKYHCLHLGMRANHLQHHFRRQMLV